MNACGRLIDKADWPYFKRAQFYFRDGDYDRAIEDFSAYIHKYPNSDKGFNERGLSYAKKGEYDRAIPDYTEAIRLNREPVGPYINRGSAFEKKGELDKALADFREALSHGSTTAPEDIKRVERAIDLLRSQQTSPQPDSDEAICRQSNSANALNACSRLIDAGGGGGGSGTGARAIRSYFWRAQIHLRNEDYDRAIEDLSKCVQLNPKHVWALNDRGSAYEKKGELNKALADFREARNNGSTTASEDINRVERAIESLRSKYVVSGLDGLSLGGRVSPQSKEYREYQCTPSAQFESVTWCNKQRDEKVEPRGLYRSSYTIAHSRDGSIYYLNQFLEPAFFNAGEVDNVIERLSGKFGEQARRVRPHVRLGPNTDGIIATWGKVALEPLDATGTSELAAGRSPRKGILVDFLGNLSESSSARLGRLSSLRWSWFRLGG